MMSEEHDRESYYDLMQSSLRSDIDSVIWNEMDVADLLEIATLMGQQSEAFFYCFLSESEGSLVSLLFPELRQAHQRALYRVDDLTWGLLIDPIGKTGPKRWHFRPDQVADISFVGTTTHIRLKEVES